jgi:hypothetical protein
MDLDREGKDTKDIVCAGAEITSGAMAGAASGFLLNGPPGVIRNNFGTLALNQYFEKN